MESPSPVEMPAIVSRRKRTRELTETGTESEIQTGGEYCDVVKRVKTEITKPIDNEVATFTQDCTRHGLEECLQLPTVTQNFTKNIHPLLYCRLCATPDNDMIDIFDFSATGISILEMINYCLPVMVKQTDTLPKQICLFCLGDLERCYRFHETVLEAEKRFLDCGQLASIKLEERERNYQTVQLCDTQRAPTEYNNIDEPLTSNEELLTVTEGAQPADTSVRSNVLLSILRPCSVLLSPIKFNCKNNSDPESKRKSSSDSKLREPDATTEASDSRATTSSENIRQSTCDSETSGLRSAKSVDPEADLPSPEQVRTRDQRYQCTFCPKLYRTRGGLNQHQRIHTKKGLHGCDFCAKKFTTKFIRDRHHRTHTQERPYKCNMCEMAFVQDSTLRTHTRFHLNQKTYACSTCNKPFRSFRGREKHRMAVHMDERPLWECDYCKRCFKRKNNLQDHVIRCNKRSGMEKL